MNNMAKNINDVLNEKTEELKSLFNELEHEIFELCKDINKSTETDTTEWWYTNLQSIRDDMDNLVTEIAEVLGD